MRGRLDKKAVKLRLPPTSDYKGYPYVYMSANIAVIENGVVKYTPAERSIAGAHTTDQLSQWQSFRSDELEKTCNVEGEDVFYCPKLDGCHCLIVKSRMSGQYWVAQINVNQAFPPSSDQPFLDDFIELMAHSFFNNPENNYASFFTRDSSKFPENDEIDVICIGDSFNKNLFVGKCLEKNIKINTLRTLSVRDHFNVVVGTIVSAGTISARGIKLPASGAKSIHIAFLPGSDRIVIYSDEFKATEFTHAIPAVHVADDVFAHPELDLNFHYLLDTYMGPVSRLFKNQESFMQDLVLFSNRFPIIEDTPRLEFMHESCPDELLRIHGCQTKEELAYQFKIDLKSKQHDTSGLVVRERKTF